MPRYRTTKAATGTLVGKLLILIAAGPETSATLASKLDVTPRQVNRYVLQLIKGGWQIERVGAWTRQDYHFAMGSPKISFPTGRRKVKQVKKGRGRRTN